MSSSRPRNGLTYVAPAFATSSAWFAREAERQVRPEPLAPEDPERLEALDGRRELHDDVRGDLGQLAPLLHHAVGVGGDHLEAHRAIDDPADLVDQVAERPLLLGDQRRVGGGAVEEAHRGDFLELVHAAGVQKDLHGLPLSVVIGLAGRPSLARRRHEVGYRPARAAATGSGPHRHAAAIAAGWRSDCGAGHRSLRGWRRAARQPSAVRDRPRVDPDTGAPYHGVSREPAPPTPRGDAMSPDQLTAEPTELLRTMIRNACVNDDTVGSGQEIRNVAAPWRTTSRARASPAGGFEAAPGRASLVARIEGRDPTAPTLLLMGHTDVVPANPAGWRRDPFGGELVDGIVWGRGATDMLNLTATMAVATRRLAVAGFRPRGTLIYLAVADEEAGGALRRAVPDDARARRGPRRLRHHRERRRAGPDAGRPRAPPHGRREGRQLAPDRRSAARRGTARGRSAPTTRS